MPQMMGKLSKMLNISKGEPDTPNSTEAITGTYKSEFMQTITQEIKELEQHGTWTIFSRKSATGAHMLSSTWDFRVKRFPDGRLRNFRAI